MSKPKTADEIMAWFREYKPNTAAAVDEVQIYITKLETEAHAHEQAMQAAQEEIARLRRVIQGAIDHCDGWRKFQGDEQAVPFLTKGLEQEFRAELKVEKSPCQPQPDIHLEDDDLMTVREHRQRAQGLEARVRELEAEHLSNCLFHRCAKHLAVPQINKTEYTGAECGACIWSRHMDLMADNQQRADRLQAEVERHNKGLLLSCPWCFIALKGTSFTQQVGHLVCCGDGVRSRVSRLEWALCDYMKLVASKDQQKLWALQYDPETIVEHRQAKAALAAAKERL